MTKIKKENFGLPSHIVEQIRKEILKTLVLFILLENRHQENAYKNTGLISPTKVL
jgi:hypothetical protein